MSPSRLGDVLRVKHGFAFAGDSFSEDPDYPTVLTPGNFRIGGGFQEARPKTFIGQIPPDYLLATGELVITMTDLSRAADTLGSPAIVPGDRAYLHNQRIGLVQMTQPNRVDRNYLSYRLRLDDYRQFIVGSASGTTVRHTSPSRIEAFSLDIPILETQRAIAEVLGALDDKIAANQGVSRVSETLLTAEFARLQSDPEARDVVASDLVEFNPRSATPTKDEPAYVDMQKLPTSGSQIMEWSSRPAQGGARFVNGDTLLARITPCLENRKAGFVDFLESGETAIGSTEFIIMRSRPGYAKPLSFLLAVDDGFRSHAIQHMIGSSGRQRVGAADLAAYELRLPLQSAALAALGDRAEAVFSLLASQRDESRHLATLRDTLLPHLMSGRITVREAEERVEEVL